jgi:hypothetical protein
MVFESGEVQRRRRQHMVSGIVAGLMTIVIGVVVVINTSCCQSGCGDTQLDYVTQQAVKQVPPGATDVEPLKDGWVKYTYEGHRYLFFFNTWSHGGYAAVTRIDWDDTTKAEGGL